MNQICVTCGLPKELCVCETIAKESQKVEISIEKKKFGKKYTVITGVDSKEIDMKDLLRKLKAKFACGGTIKDNVIELQGDHKIKVRETLEGLGFPPETIVIKA
ncbi:translation initiation factor [Candidatus Woesearchaeota archaeon]|nr:translation initiation factor [Candidatus Woesearchaeota archaeon]